MMYGVQGMNRYLGKSCLSKLLLTVKLACCVNFASATCFDPAGPGVDYSGCVLTDGLDGSDDGMLRNLDLRNANLSNSQILNQIEAVDFRGANFEGASYYYPGEGLDYERISFENTDSQFYDTQFLLSLRATITGSSEYQAGMYLKGVGFISPTDGNRFGPGGNSGKIKLSQLSDPATGELIVGDLAPIRYAQSVYEPWVSLGTNGESGFGYRQRMYSAAINASSNQGPTGNAHYAVDGISSDQGWISNSENSPWWEIDLGGHYKIENIVITARDDAGGLAALQDAVVMVSDYSFPQEPLISENLDSISRYAELDAPLQSNFIPVNRTVRYLRIQKPSAEAQVLGIKSIEIKGLFVDSTGQAFTPDFPMAQTGDIDPYENVANECLGELFDPSEVRSCEFPLPSLLQTGEILLTDPELDYRNCDLTNEILTNISFNVELQEGSLSGAFQLQGADLSGVDLRGADLSGISLYGANLRGANLTDANFGDANISGVDFRGAVTIGVDFGNVVANSCALFSNELPNTVNPEINDEPGKPRPQAIPESNNVGYGYARQSSTDNNGVPSLAIDNDLNSYSQTALEDSPWWELDLGGVYSVSSIEFLVDVSQQSTLEGLQLLASDWPLPLDPSNKIDSSQITSYPIVLTPGTDNQFKSTVNRTVRYVRVVVSNSSSPQRLSLNNVKVSASAIPTAPSTFVPLTNTQRSQLGAVSEFQDLLVDAETQLSDSGEDSIGAELATLSREAVELHEILLRYKERFSTAASLRKSITYARRTVKALRLYRPLKKSPQMEKLEKSLDKAKTIANIIVAPYAALEGTALAGRYSLNEILSGVGAANKQIYSTLRYLNIGNNYLELNLRCVLFDDLGDNYLPPLIAKVSGDVPLMQSYLAGLAKDKDPRQRIAKHLAAIRETRASLDPIEDEIAAIHESVVVLKNAFEEVFSPLADIGKALSAEIDLGVYTLSVTQVIEVVESALNSIPGLAEAEAAVAALLDPLIQPLLEQIDALPELGLPDVPNLDGLAELANSFVASINVTDPFVYDLPDFRAEFDDLADVACTGVTAPRLWPKDDEDLDGDGLPNGIELKRVTPDPYGDKLETLANSADTDLDGLNDYFEVTLARFVPTTSNFEDEVNADYDNDGLTNLEEFLNNTDPFAADTDGDGLIDKVEIQAKLDPTSKDSDNNGVNDLDEDSDGDGLTNKAEISISLNIADASDVNHDDDDDGVSNISEFQKGTAINNSPPLAVDDEASVVAGENVEIAFLANDSQTDDDPIEVLQAQIDFPTKGAWTIQDGVIRLETGSAFSDLSEGQSETLAFIYKLKDQGGTSAAIITVTVTAPTGQTEPTEPEEPADNSSGGGSIGWLLSFCLLLVGRRRSLRNNHD